MKKNKSIKLKMFLYFTLFSAVLILILWFFQIVFLDSFYKWSKTQGLKLAASSIEKNINSDNFDEVAEQTSQSYEACIYLASVSETETPIVSHHIPGSCLIHRLPNTNEILETLKESDGEVLYYGDDIPNAIERKPAPFSAVELPTEPRPAQFAPFRLREKPTEFLNLHKIISAKDGSEYMLLIGCTISPVNTTVQTLRIQLYFVTGVMLIISSLLAIYISRKVAHPIERINDEAAKLATGNYSVEFSGGGYREADELSNTLNYAASELKKTDALQKELIANISHDLRTPLTLIAGYAEAMRDLPGEDNAENAQIIIDEAMRLSGIVKDVLDISKVQSGVDKLDLQAFNITKLLHGDIKRMSEFLCKQGYTFIFDYEGELSVIADESKISQVLYNLLNNAVHYTGDDKKISIKQLEENGFVKIEITDSGEGIAEDQKKIIWERYYKSGESHRRRIQGAGLGLSIVKSVMDLHGYEYGVVSEKGKGSTFYIYLRKAVS